MLKIKYKKIKLAIQSAKKILVTAHQKPDGDALGSIFAITKYLESQGKNYKIYIEGENNYKNMPFLNFTSVDIKNISNANFDALITLDSGDLARTGLDKAITGLKIINIDHHISNNNFGDINLVNSNASSTTEILTKFFQTVNFEIDKDTASALLLGILTDTDNFSNKGTSSDAFAISSYLLEKGANIAKFNRNNHKNKKIDTLKFWGKSFERIKENKQYNFAHTVIHKNEIKNAEKNGFIEKVEDLVNFFNNLKNLDFVMVLKEQENSVKISLRTTKENINLSYFAIFFNGGGHKKAAGFTINGCIKKTAYGWKIV
ncbi:MAG: bifunctional oligoribonuclease/PAP phosphatase NrnA [Patescibacteria group bacterium]|nr:bifunctional oligoribonuclease/PAP phosphatase NrnA [Patescibacteria group bacterium]